MARRAHNEAADADDAQKKVKNTNKKIEKLGKEIEKKQQKLDELNQQSTIITSAGTTAGPR